ncbi:class I SAM-dependent methyltransferase [Streptomyces sp. NPDC021080]|uniref:class I SAM-dependent methyltransferase n=1 Tax=Streptomyces sp. NPDC021080 TaxID=3365110 RepID=UPI0037B122F2
MACHLLKGCDRRCVGDGPPPAEGLCRLWGVGLRVRLDHDLAVPAGRRLRVGRLGRALPGRPDRSVPRRHVADHGASVPARIAVPGCSRAAARRLGATATPVERCGVDGQSLPFADDSFDAALSTWTLCTIPDADAALREVRRVLRPGRTLHFVEHGLAPDEQVRRWQHRLDPMEQRIFDGCHLTRPIVDLLTSAGFTIAELDVFYEKGAPKAMGADSLGIAVSP